MKKDAREHPDPFRFASISSRSSWRIYGAGRAAGKCHISMDDEGRQRTKRINRGRVQKSEMTSDGRGVKALMGREDSFHAGERPG